MRRLTLFVLGGLLALAATILVIVNLYVQSQGTQARIQQELGQRLGTAIHIKGISVTPWGGLTLSGITVPQSSAANAGDFLQAESFHLHVRFLSLFSQRLVIKEVSLIGPNVVWPQDADGKWRLPHSSEADHSTVRADEMAKTSPLPTETGSTIPPVGPSATAPVPPTAGANVSKFPPKTATPPAAFVPEVRRVNITDGNFRFLDAAGNVVANFERVRFRSSVRNTQALRGDAGIGKISLRDRFFLENLHSPLHYDPQELDLSEIVARAGSGDVNGHFTIHPQAEDSPFSVQVKFRDVQADQIVGEAGGPNGVIRGKLEGTFEAAGKTADANALNGKGEIFLRDGQLQQYSLLVALGQILQIEELTQLQLQQAEAKYHISPGLVTIDELILRSPNIRLSATGTVAFNGKLRLDSQLAINDKIRGQLFKPIRENFQPVAEAGYSAVDFQVAGTIDRPKTNLMDKVVGRDLKDFVSGLLGGGKSDRKKKKKAADAQTPPVSPAPTPVEPAQAEPAATATPP